MDQNHLESYFRFLNVVNRAVFHMVFSLSFVNCSKILLQNKLRIFDFLYCDIWLRFSVLLMFRNRRINVSSIWHVLTVKSNQLKLNKVNFSTISALRTFVFVFVLFTYFPLSEAFFIAQLTSLWCVCPLGASPQTETIRSYTHTTIRFLLSILCLKNWLNFHFGSDRKRSIGHGMVFRTEIFYFLYKSKRRPFTSRIYSLFSFK